MTKECPTCKAKPGTPCVSITGKITTTHQARILGYVGRRNHLRARR